MHIPATIPATPTAHPDVSVVLAAGTDDRDVEATLESALQQTWTDFEVIAVNDGWAERPRLGRALRSFAQTRYLEQPRRTRAAALNAGIRAASGRYLAFLTVGDRWRPDFLQAQRAFLAANPLCDLVYCDAVIHGPAGASKRFMELAPSRGPVTVRALVSGECTVPLSTALVRHHRLVAAGLFDETLRAGEDFDLALRLAMRGVTMRYQRLALAELRAAPAGSVHDVEIALNVLERFGRAQLLPVTLRTALRIRTLSLVDRLEIEQAKQRVIEGNFAAARFHLAAPRERGLRLRAALLAIRVAPKLARRIYLAIT